MCPEKEVKFQRAPNGEPCLPTHPPTPCCLRPPASHANPFCHVRVLPSSSLHVCAMWADVACPARQGPLPKVAWWPKKWALECVVWHPLLQSSDCLQQPQVGSEAGSNSGPGGNPRERPSFTVAQEERPCSPGTSSHSLQTKQPVGTCMVGREAGYRPIALSLTLLAFSPVQGPISRLGPVIYPSPQGK